MRVITCQEKDELVIGEHTHIEIVKIYNNRVLLGITSPDEIPPYREKEVFLVDEDGNERTLEPQQVS